MLDPTLHGDDITPLSVILFSIEPYIHTAVQDDKGFLFFLVLLMIVPDSSKLIFLVLWIVSLFAIAVYLIGVEYVDYKLQEKMNEISGRDAQCMSVSPVVQIDDRVQEIAERVEQRFDTMQQSKGEDAEQ